MAVKEYVESIKEELRKEIRQELERELKPAMSNGPATVPPVTATVDNAQLLAMLYEESEEERRLREKEEEILSKRKQLQEEAEMEERRYKEEKERRVKESADKNHTQKQEEDHNRRVQKMEEELKQLEAEQRDLDLKFEAEVRRKQEQQVYQFSAADKDVAVLCSPVLSAARPNRILSPFHQAELDRREKERLRYEEMQEKLKHRTN